MDKAMQQEAVGLPEKRSASRKMETQPKGLKETIMQLEKIE